MRFSLLGSTGSTLFATSHAEQVENVTKALSSTATFSKSLFAVFVIKLPFFRIAKYFIGNSNILKLLRITTFVRMFFKCFLPKSFLDLITSSVLFYAYQIIKFCGINFFLLLTVHTVSAHEVLFTAAWSERKSTTLEKE